MFTQTPPTLGNQYTDDVFMQDYLRRVVPQEVLTRIEPSLERMGALAGDELYRMQLADRLNEPRLIQWDAWGNRIDEVELTPLWRRAAVIAAQEGLVAIPYEQQYGRFSRIYQFAAVFLFHPSSDFYTCPLAMSDGAARTLIKSANESLIERAVVKLTSRDPASVWTSGQWMTEATGGSDVGSSLTEATPENDGTWSLRGKKWFTSAVNSQMALTLARPQGNAGGGRNLALFYVETRTAEGGLNAMRIERLKDKLGTRKVPTAELVLDGTRSKLVGEAREGTRAIEPMLVITRAWNGISAAACMRRAIALARSYARERYAFGKPLEALPLHSETLAWMEAEAQGVFLLAFEVAALIGREEAVDVTASERALLRLLTPIAKLATAKQAVAVVSEAIEAFGGAGYVEDTGLPMLLRDTQVLPIWEGTTNVLALDAVLRGDLAAGLTALNHRVDCCCRHLRNPMLIEHARPALLAMDQARSWIRSAPPPETLQSGARRFAMTLARAIELALLAEHAQWQIDTSGDTSGIQYVERFAQSIKPFV